MWRVFHILTEQILYAFVSVNRGNKEAKGPNCNVGPSFIIRSIYQYKKHLKNVGPIRHCEPPHAHLPGVASGTVARRLRINVHDNNDNDNA